MRLSSGSADLDAFLGGGYESDVITTVYGPGGAGKSNLCLICTVNIAGTKKVIFVDTEGNFSVERVKQLAPDYKERLEAITLFKPTNFDEQKRVFSKLKGAISERVGLIVVDSIAMLYRLELGKSQKVYEVNKALGLQLAYLTEISRKMNIPVLLTNQVYSDFDNKDKVNMVGGDILRYGSKCLIELQKYHNNKRKAVLQKHRSLPEGKDFYFEIAEKGIKKFIPQ
ncbi:MAG: DNA repair and recombination protein RadB [archaeon]